MQYNTQFLRHSLSNMVPQPSMFLAFAPHPRRLAALPRLRYLLLCCASALGCIGYAVLRLMPQDDDRQVAEFRQKLEAMVAAAEDAKKKAATARTRVLVADVLLK
jgi:hypothetical protein